jgi:hypothetical protein
MSSGGLSNWLVRIGMPVYFAAGQANLFHFDDFSIKLELVSQSME